MSSKGVEIKTPHFFKAYSRIGLAHIPYGQKSLNLGVEEGPDGVLDEEFLASLNNPSLDSFRFTNPEDIEEKNFNSILAEEIKAFSALLDDQLKKGETQIVIGGDHTITLPSVLSVLKRAKGKKVGYVQVDSHGDILLNKESSTKNFHGMYVRPLLEEFDIPEIKNLVGDLCLDPKKMVYFGNLDLEEKEKEFFKKKRIINFSGEDLKNSKKAEEWFKKFIKGVDYLHISIDIDAFDKTIAPATGIPAEKGLFFEDVERILQVVKTHPNFSLDLAEVNPKKEGAQKTISLAQKILKILIAKQEKR